MKQLTNQSGNGILKGLLLLMISVSVVGCKSPGRFDNVAPGIKGQDLLSNYGAPDRIQKVMQYDVWIYTEYNSKQCQLIMKKNELTQPAKCFYTPRGLASQSLISNK